jgi:surface polysaccharide O-acyltransferase-like enzyme
MKRIISVDVMKVVAIISVIMIHTTPFYDMPLENDFYKYISFFMNQIPRFAVPFFFIISGYFWGYKIQKGTPVMQLSMKMLKRLSIIFICWSVIYILPYNVSSIFSYGILGPFRIVHDNIAYLIENPLNLIFEGTKIHLWFLVSLASALIIASLFIKNQWEKSLIFVSIILYIFGLLAKAYTSVGIAIEFNTRNGPFFSTIFFTIGYILSKYKHQKKWFFYGILLFIVGLILHLSEVYVIWKYLEGSSRQDYVVGTLFMGTGISIAALSNHPVLRITPLARLGKYVLGIYVIHYLFVDLFEPIDKVVFNTFWELGYVVLVMLLSVFSVFILSKGKTTKKIVM